VLFRSLERNGFFWRQVARSRRSTTPWRWYVGWALSIAIVVMFGIFVGGWVAHLLPW